MTNSTGLFRISRRNGHMVQLQDAGIPANLGGSSVIGIRGGGAISSICSTKFLIGITRGLCLDNLWSTLLCISSLMLTQTIQISNV